MTAAGVRRSKEFTIAADPARSGGVISSCPADQLANPVRWPWRVAVRFGVVAALGPACGKPRPRTEDECEALSELVLRIPADEEARYA